MSHRRLQIFVDFQADLSFPGDSENDRGKWLAELLEHELTGLGFPVSERGPCAEFGDVALWHSLKCKSGAMKYEISVGVEPSGRWWIGCPPRLGFFAKLLGRTEHQEHEKLLGVIAGILERHRDVTAIRWFREWTDEEDRERLPYYASPRASSPLRERIRARNAWEAFQDISDGYFRALPWLWLAMMGFAVLAFGVGVERIAGLDSKAIYLLLQLSCFAWFGFTGLGIVWQGWRCRKQLLAAGQPLKLILGAFFFVTGIAFLFFFVYMLIASLRWIS